MNITIKWRSYAVPTTRPRRLYKTVSKSGLYVFGLALCKHLNFIYKNEKFAWMPGGFVWGKGSVALVAFYGKKSDFLPEMSQEIAQVFNEFDNSTSKKRRISFGWRGYFHKDGYDVVIIVHPQQLRCWTLQKALQDFLQIFNDLLKSGY